MSEMSEIVEVNVVNKAAWLKYPESYEPLGPLTSIIYSKYSQEIMVHFFYAVVHCLLHHYIFFVFLLMKRPEK